MILVGFEGGVGGHDSSFRMGGGVGIVSGPTKAAPATRVIKCPTNVSPSWGCYTTTATICHQAKCTPLVIGPPMIMPKPSVALMSKPWRPRCYI